MKQLPLISFLLHKVLSQQRQQPRFVSTSIRAAIRSFVCLKFSTLALLKAFIVKTSFFQPFLENIIIWCSQDHNE